MITRGTLHSELLYFMIRPKPCRHPKNREKLWDHTCGRDFSKEILVMDVLYRKIFQWNSHSTIQHKCILSLTSALVLPKLFSVMWILPLTLQVTENCPTRHLVVIESLLCCCDLQHMQKLFWWWDGPVNMIFWCNAFLLLIRCLFEINLRMLLLQSTR